MAAPEGEDLFGRTALPLLASSQQGCRVLFLVRPDEAVINTVPFATPFERVPLPEGGAIPIPDHAVDCVVIDASGFASSAEALRLAAAETGRVLRDDGDALLLAPAGRIPRDLSSLSTYGWRSPSRVWMDAFTSHGLRHTRSQTARLDRGRLVEVMSAAGDHRPGRPRPELLTFRRRGESVAAIADGILAEVAATLGVPGAERIERFFVRKIGKTTVIARVGSQRIIVRIPRSQLALRRAEGNDRALRTLHDNGTLPASAKQLIPRALARGECRGYPYFVEECAEGTDLAPAGSRWEPDALQFLTELHLRSRRSTVVDASFFEERFVRPVRHLERVLGADHSRACAGLIEAMQGVVGQEIPLVWSHGDFGPGNCLYDSAGRLSGVVDWELFSQHSFPLLDVLHSMPVPGESNSHARWQRFDAVIEMLDGRGVPAEISNYLTAVQVNRALVPALMIMYWVDHIERRIDARRSDTAWMQKRVYQPLAALDRMLARVS